MSPTSRSLSALTLAAFAGLTAPAFAQGTGKEVAVPRGTLGQPSQDANMSSRERTPPVVTVNFAGGPVGEYIKALRESTGEEPVNVILSTAAAELVLSPITLRNVSLDVAVQAISAAAGDAAGGFSIRRIKPLADVSNQASPVYAVDFVPREFPRGARHTSPSETPLIQVFSLRPITEAEAGDPLGASVAERAETVLTAVQTALDIAPNESGQPAELKFHRDSGLLIVRGTRSQIAAVEESMHRMQADVDRRRATTKAAAVPEEALIERRARAQKARVLMEQSMRELELSRNNFARVQELVAAGSVSTGELTEAQLRLDTAESHVRTAEVELMQMQEMLRLIERSRAAAASGPTVVDLSSWPKEQYSSVLLMLKSLTEGDDRPARVEDIGGQSALITGDARQIDLLVNILREVARARRLDSPNTRPAESPAQGGGGGR